MPCAPAATQIRAASTGLGSPKSASAIPRLAQRGDVVNVDAKLEHKLKIFFPSSASLCQMRRGLANSIHILIAPVPWFAVSSVMPKPHVFLKFWLPVLLWMAVIFTASADSHSYEHSSRFFEPLLHWLFPNMPQAKVDFIHHIFRKCAHLTEYAILALLLWRALHVSKNKLPAWSWPKVGGTLLLVFLYASSVFRAASVSLRRPWAGMSIGWNRSAVRWPSLPAATRPEPTKSASAAT